MSPYKSDEEDAARVSKTSPSDTTDIRATVEKDLAALEARLFGSQPKPTVDQRKTSIKQVVSRIIARSPQ
jgi:hypothetical protein